MLKLEGITFDRQETWPSSSASKSGVNGFVAIKTLQKPFSGTVLGLDINLAVGTKILLKYIGQYKHWIEGINLNDPNLDGMDMRDVDRNIIVSAKDKDNITKILLKDVKNFVTDLEASKKSDAQKDQDGYDMLKDLFYYIDERGERTVKVANFLRRVTIKEATNQQKAAMLGVAPKVYGYNENSLQWCMTMEFLKDAVYDEDNKDSYLNTKVIPIHARQQLVALCHILDTNGICHKDLKPDNYRMRGNRLYIIDYGLSKDVGKKHYTNMNCLHWGGWTFYARSGLGMFGAAIKELRPLKLQQHSKYMQYDHNVAKQNSYKVGDVVLMNEGQFYMLYRCTNKERQDEIYFPGLKVKGKGSKKEIILTPGTKENKDKLKLQRSNNDYFRYVVMPNLGKDESYAFTKPYNVWDRPAWKAMWIHPSIPFSLEECIKAYKNKVWRKKLKM